MFFASHIFYSLSAYLNYRINSTTRHGIHSPFVYRFTNEVIRVKNHYAEFVEIEQIRESMLNLTNVIEITDFGTGKGNRDYELRFERVQSIAENDSVSKKEGKLLFNLVKFFKPDTIIEIGTSLGISTVYLAKAAPEARLHTLEGCSTKSQLAASNFSKLHLTKIQQHIGKFDLTLPKALAQINKLDLAFIDGNHSYHATIKYFELLLQKAHNDTVFVFDDIHWSADMGKAWMKIIGNEHVTASIDLFSMGIVFFRKELSKQAFVIQN